MTEIRRKLSEVIGFNPSRIIAEGIHDGPASIDRKAAARHGLDVGEISDRRAGTATETSVVMEFCDREFMDRHPTPRRPEASAILCFVSRHTDGRISRRMLGLGDLLDAIAEEIAEVKISELDKDGDADVVAEVNRIFADLIGTGVAEFESEPPLMLFDMRTMIEHVESENAELRSLVRQLAELAGVLGSDIDAMVADLKAVAG